MNDIKYIEVMIPLLTALTFFIISMDILRHSWYNPEFTFKSYTLWRIQSFKGIFGNIKAKRFIKELKRSSCGKYCDYPKCYNPRIDHVHGTSQGVIYHCQKHAKWARKLGVIK